MFYYQGIHKETKNDHLRRLAESVATEISPYAEENKLEGDLSRQTRENV